MFAGGLAGVTTTLMTVLRFQNLSKPLSEASKKRSQSLPSRRFEASHELNQFQIQDEGPFSDSNRLGGGDQKVFVPEDTAQASRA